MAAYGHSEYSAADDWDGDSMTNYEEYVAGTNPFDPSDYLRVTSFSVTCLSSPLSPAQPIKHGTRSSEANIKARTFFIQ